MLKAAHVSTYRLRSAAKWSIVRDTRSIWKTIESATLISRLRRRLGALGLLCGGGLALLLPLSILRRRGFFSCHAVHRFGRRMLIGFCRTSTGRLTDVAGVGPEPASLPRVLQGPACAAPTPKTMPAKPARMTCFVIIIASPWFPSFDG